MLNKKSISSTVQRQAKKPPGRRHPITSRCLQAVGLKVIFLGGLYITIYDSPCFRKLWFSTSDHVTSLLGILRLLPLFLK